MVRSPMRSMPIFCTMSVPTAWHSARALAAFFSVFLGAVGAAGAASEPSWLALKPGQTALVGAAPWPMEQPEAALSGSPRSAAVSPDDYARRPDDALHQPIGLRVTVEDIVADGVGRGRTGGATTPRGDVGADARAGDRALRPRGLRFHQDQSVRAIGPPTWLHGLDRRRFHRLTGPERDAGVDGGARLPLPHPRISII